MRVCVGKKVMRAAEDFCRGKTVSTISFICAAMLLMYIVDFVYFPLTECHVTD